MAMPIPLPQQGPESSPKAIRATLLPEDLETFDEQYRSALTEAMETLDLQPLLELLESWRRWGISSTLDPEAHRRMVQKVARLEAGEDLPMVPWSETKKRLGLG